MYMSSLQYSMQPFLFVTEIRHLIRSENKIKKKKSVSTDMNCPTVKFFTPYMLPLKERNLCAYQI